MVDVVAARRKPSGQPFKGVLGWQPFTSTVTASGRGNDIATKDCSLLPHKKNKVVIHYVISIY
ncbi:MAG: hypothetical protein ACKOU6_01960, partial [Planctomycetota bacterium]